MAPDAKAAFVKTLWALAFAVVLAFVGASVYALLWRNPFPVEQVSASSRWIDVGLLLLGLVGAFALSLALLRRGPLYPRFRPDARPMRWLLFGVVASFATFLIWFPVSVLWPGSSATKIATIAFGVTFVTLLAAIKLGDYIRALGQTIVSVVTLGRIVRLRSKLKRGAEAPLEK